MFTSLALNAQRIDNTTVYEKDTIKPEIIIQIQKRLDRQQKELASLRIQNDSLKKEIDELKASMPSKKKRKKVTVSRVGSKQVHID